MNTLIKTKDNLILVNEDAMEKNDKVYHLKSNKIDILLEDFIVTSDFKKVLCQSPNIKLSKEVNEVVGWVDAGKAIEFADEIHQKMDYDKGRWYGRVEGFQASQKLNENLFTEEDIKNAISFGINTQHTLLTPKGIEMESDKLIESLKQPKQWSVEYEIEEENYLITKILDK